MMSTKQKFAARYLAGGLSQRATAKEVGVSLKTLRIWLARLYFKRYMRRIARQYMHALDDELISLRTQAFSVLRDAMEQDKNLKHREWAVESVFTVERTRARLQQDKADAQAKQPAVSVNVLQGPGEALSAQQKELGKAYLATFRGVENTGDSGLSVREGEA